MDSLITVFLIITLVVITLLGGGLFFILLLRKNANKNKKEYKEFASKIMPSMIGGIIVFLATKLIGISPFSIGGAILYAGIIFYIFFILYIGFFFFNLKLYDKEEGKNLKEFEDKTILKEKSYKTDNNVLKWVSITGLIISISTLIIAFSTYYFNVYLHAPFISYVKLDCSQQFDKVTGELKTISLINNGDGGSYYQLSLIGEGTAFKESNVGMFLSEEQLKEYKSTYVLNYYIGPKATNTFYFHIYPTNKTMPTIGFFIDVEYKTFPNIPIPFFQVPVKNRILNCYYQLNSTNYVYYFIK
jgi:magnesium-transporting ATPase (P-type)